MCDPITLGVAQGGLSLIGASAAVSEQNAASARNRQNAVAAMNEQQAQEQENYVEQQRSLIQGGFDAILQGREDEATAYASALQNGVSGGSVKAVLRESRQRAARSQDRTQQEMSSLRTQTTRNQRGIQTQTQGRINSVARTSLNIGDFASALAPIGRAAMG